MMPALQPPTALIDRLPAVRGRITANASLAAVTWFGVGGPAEVMFRPVDAEDLAQFLGHLDEDVPVTVIGVASNLLVRDGGIPGVVIRLGRDFAGIRPELDHVDGPRLVAGAAALDVNVATIAAEAGLAGLEFLTGIPGTIGGAVRMNAGAYGSDMAAITRTAQTIDRSGNVHELSLAELGFTYRHSDVPEDWIVTGAVLTGTLGDPVAIRGRLMEIREERERAQPIRAKTGGSTFKNPPGHKAWELIDKAGCRGLRLGAAQVSEKHTNFLINVGGATAAEIEELGETVRRRVYQTSGVELEWEIKRVGEPA